MGARAMLENYSRYAVLLSVLLFALLFSAFSSAAQVSERSIELSSSSISAQNVTYSVKYTAVQPAQAFVIDFCSNSPSIGAACTAPNDFNATNAASTTAGFTDVTGSSHSILVVGAIAANDAVQVALTGIHNPSSAGPLYARIVTYDTPSHAEGYQSDNLGSGVQDMGSVAIAITPTIGVGGTVLESLTFCVSGSPIEADCAGAAANPPALQLGEGSDEAKALTSNAVSTGMIYTQVTTNAVNGAIINLKSDVNGCGGLRRAGAPTACDIGPALRDGIIAGQARFGVKTSFATDSPGVDGSGTLVPVIGSGYNNISYALNFMANNSSGVTSPFGDPFIDTDGAPAHNKNMALVFGASISNETPAGTYSADISLIATGKF